MAELLQHEYPTTHNILFVANPLWCLFAILVSVDTKHCSTNVFIRQRRFILRLPIVLAARPPSGRPNFLFNPSIIHFF